MSSRKTRLPHPTDRLALGPGALAVSPFCLGAVQEPEVIAEAFDAGINFFFLSADMHWPFYEASRRGLQDLLARGGGIRERLVIAVAAYVTQPEFCTLPYQEVLEALPALERIDLMVAGGAKANDLLPRLHVLEANRAAGVCGATALGASFHDRSAAAQAVRGHLVDIAFVRYNASHPGAERDLFPQLGARQHRALVFNFKSVSGWVPPVRFPALGLGPEYWQPSLPDHYRLVLGRPELDGVLCAFRVRGEVASALRVLERGPLTDEEASYLVDLARLAEGRARLLPPSPADRERSDRNGAAIAP